MGVARAKANGAEVVARMKAMPCDDDCFGPGTIREDGRKLHPAYLFEVKRPDESRGRYDYYKLLQTTAGAPLLLVKTTAYLESREPIEATTSYYRADKYEFITDYQYTNCE